MIGLKQGVDARAIQPQMLLALLVARDVFQHFNVPLLVTSISDSKHGTNSLHYSGNAVDLRLPSRYDELTPGLDAAVTARLKVMLEAQYDVVLESDHIHVEFDPKPPMPGVA